MEKHKKKKYSFYSILLVIVSIMLFLFLKNSPKSSFVSKQESIKENTKESFKKSEGLTSSTRQVTVSRLNKMKSSACYKLLNEKSYAKKFINKNDYLLNQIFSRWIYSSDAPIDGETAETNSLQTKFILGLAKAGFFEAPSKKIDINYKEAIKLLREVALLDPKNSAPWLYLAVIAKKFNHNKTYRYYMSRAHKTSYFNSYILDFTKLVHKLVESPEDYIGLIHLRSSLRIPNYNPLLEILTKPSSAKFAYQLMDDGLNPNNKNESIDWLAIDYVVGLSVLRKLKIKHSHPDYRKRIHREMRETPQSEELREKVFNSDSSKCNMNLLWDYYNLTFER